VSVGHAIGAGNGPKARRAGWLALALGTGFMLLAALVFVAVPRPLIALYTTDAQVMAVGPALLGLAAIFQIFDGIQTVCTGALRGLGETRSPMIANFVGYWILGLPIGLGLCFVAKWGIYGLWIGLTLALVVIATALLMRWKKDASRAAGRLADRTARASFYEARAFAQARQCPFLDWPRCPLRKDSNG